MPPQLADTTVDIDPTPEELAETAILAAEKVRLLDIEPRIAMLSFSNFGSVTHPQALKVKRAVEIVKERAPDTVRIMLTGNADLESAIKVVNEGNIFRFLTKPCPADILSKAVEDALGIRIKGMPITAEKVALALRKSRRP